MRTRSKKLNLSNSLVQAMMRLLKDSFIACKSDPPSDAFPDAQRFSVVVHFNFLRDAQEFHGIVIDLWNAANNKE